MVRRWFLCFASVFQCGRIICSVKTVEDLHVCFVYVCTWFIRVIYNPLFGEIIKYDMTWYSFTATDRWQKVGKLLLLLIFFLLLFLILLFLLLLLLFLLLLLLLLLLLFFLLLLLLLLFSSSSSFSSSSPSPYFSSSPSSSSSSSSSSISTTAHCGLWPVEQCRSIFSYLPPTLSIFSLPELEDLFLLPLSIIISFILPGFSTVCTFHVATVISVYPVFFPPSSFNLTSFSSARLS